MLATIIMKKLIALCLYLVSSLNSINAQSIETFFLDGNDSTKSYFVKIKPNNKIQAAIVFIPGLYQTPEELLLETEIDNLVAENNIMLVVPFLTKKSLHFEKETISFLKTVVNKVFNDHQIENQNLLIGGFSSGGATAALFAEMSLSNTIELIKPKGLFLIDSPIDNERLALNELKSSIYKNLDIQKNRNTHVSAYFVARFQEVFGKDYLHNEEFYKYSPYVKSDTSFSNIKPLLEIPIRFYSEPDFDYFFERDGTKFNPNVMNILDGSPFINDLKLLGHSNAELILTKNKGFRKNQNNKRHPHSISIVDSEEFLTWVMKVIKG